MTKGPKIPPSRGPQAPSRHLVRRGFVLGGVALVVAAAAGYGQWHNLSATVGEGALSVQDAHKHALSGEVLLIDIRRPDEWARTGIGQGAVAMDMRRPDFIAALLVQTDGLTDRPVALICARGVRSRGMGKRLAQAGFTRVLDVPEGMLGSGAGPGWLNAGLPVVQP